MAPTCRGAFDAHLHHVEPREAKRVGSPRAAIDNGSLERTAECHPALHERTVSRFTKRSGVGVVFSVFLKSGLH